MEHHDATIADGVCGPECARAVGESGGDCGAVEVQGTAGQRQLVERSPRSAESSVDGLTRWHAG